MGEGRCCYCGRPAVRERRWGLIQVRAWCRPCLDRIRHTGIVDWHEYPSYEESHRSGVPSVIDFV